MIEIKKDKAYAFTNENLKSYRQLYDFEGAKVLSVMGSGDQYFASILYGAKEVTLFDNNPNVWYHFLLKYASFLALSYEEFCHFFIDSRLSDRRFFERVIPYLEEDAISYLSCIKLPTLVKHSVMSDDETNYRTDRIIPYFNEEMYYELQKKLKERSLPKFYLCDITELENLIREPYDLALFSNVYHYLKCTEEEFYSFLDAFPVQTIQALYTWILSSEEKKAFLEQGFEIAEVENVIPYATHTPNYVLSLRK